MLTKLEKIKIYSKEIQNKFFKNNLFKFNDLSKYNVESTIKVIKGIGQYTYGYDINGIDKYFIFIDSNNEGFIWTRSHYKENGSYHTYEKAIATNKYLKMENIIIENLNLNKMRNLHLERIRSFGQKNENYSFEQVLSTMTFSNFGPKLNKVQRTQLLGIVMLSIFFNFQNDFNKDLSEDTILLCEQFKNSSFEIENTIYSDINYIVSKVIIDNINYIVKENISLKSVFKFIKKLI